VESSNVDFSDRFIKPNYSANLTDLSGSITGLAPGGRGAVDLHGRIDRAGTVQISGSLHPFDATNSLDLSASARDIDLPKFSPYSEKYVGYGIEKGKLSADVHYALNGKALSAQNNIVLDQLTFGEKVDTPSVFDWPIRFAVALLKDRNGVIDVNLPIEGSLEDPQFSLGGVILKVIGNLIVKVVTAPFSLLASLIEGAPDDLAAVPFDAGNSALSASAQQSVQALAQALEKRPGLRVDISGRADSAADTRALQEQALERQLLALKRSNASGPQSAQGEPAQAQIDPGERDALIRKLWQARPVAKSAGPASGQPEIAAMREALLSATAVSPEALRELATARAVAVKERLIQAHGISGERIFVTAPRLDAQGLEEPAAAASAPASQVSQTSQPPEASQTPPTPQASPAQRFSRADLMLH
jgi:hypothetical protein